MFSLDSYSMLSNDDILELPIYKFVKPNVSLVVIWCTNAPSLHRFVTEELLPKWKLKLIANWYWVKVSITSFIHLLVFFKTELLSIHRSQILANQFVNSACHFKSNHLRGFILHVTQKQMKVHSTT